MADKLRTQQQLEQLQARYVGTGHADTSPFEFKANTMRDYRASIVGHPEILQHTAIGMGISRERVRIAQIEAMVVAAGRAPPTDEPKTQRSGLTPDEMEKMDRMTAFWAGRYGVHVPEEVKQAAQAKKQESSKKGPMPATSANEVNKEVPLASTSRFKKNVFHEVDLSKEIPNRKPWTPGQPWPPAWAMTDEPATDVAATEGGAVEGEGKGKGDNNPK